MTPADRARVEYLLDLAELMVEITELMSKPALVHQRAARGGATGNVSR